MAIRPGTLCYVVGPLRISPRIVTVVGVVGHCPVCGRPIQKVCPSIGLVGTSVASDEVCENALRPINDPDLTLEPGPVEVPKEIAA